jgi:5-methylcytosine-specific restriction endonuclease McrA
MLNLTPLEGPAIDWYDRIAAAKHLETRRRLQGLRAAVSQRYDAYAQASPTLEKLPATPFTTDEERKVLKHCYTSETQPLNELKAAIRDRQSSLQRALCPYCGINSPGTMEHYLPKEEFPEYAVCAYNLLPACGECNGLKLEQWLGPKGRKVLHLYHDRIPQGVRWLHAKVELRQDLPVMTFELRQPAALSGTLYGLVQEHYDTLHLLERYQVRASELLSEARATASGLAHVPQHLAPLFSGLAQSLASRHGHNYWKVAAYLCLTSSPESLDWLHRRGLESAAPAPKTA